MPLITYFKIIEASKAGIIPLEMIIFAGGLIVGLYFILEFIYFLVLGTITISFLLNGDSFRWLETLPILQDSRKKICFAACFRSFDIPLIAIGAALPIYFSIFTLNIFVVIVSVVISILNILFSFSLLVILGEKFARFTKGTEIDTKRSNVVRTLSMVSYIVASIGIATFVNIGLQYVTKMFDALASARDLSAWVSIFSLIPYPFAPGYLLVAASSPIIIPNSLWISTLIGVGLLGILTWLFYRRALHVLRSVITTEPQGVSLKRGSVPHGKVESFKISPCTPVQAFRRKDLATVSRDVQSLTFIILPLMIPFITLLIPFLIVLGGGDFGSPSGPLLYVWNFATFACISSSIAMIAGLSNLENTGGTISASLPILTRHQAKAKLSVMIPIQLTGFILPIIMFLINSIPIVMFATLPFITTLLLASFLLKVRLFGRLKYKYVLEEVQMSHKVTKWILVLLVDIGIWALIALPGYVLFQAMNLENILALLLTVGGMGLVVCYFIFNRMFPRR